MPLSRLCFCAVFCSFPRGLGTSTAVEAKNYFSDLPKHNLHFTYQGSLDDDAIELAFSRAKADARKDWLKTYEPGTYLSHEPGVAIPYADFVHKELILFSIASNTRAIPSLLDGLKPGQRKILFCAFKRNLRKEIKGESSSRCNSLCQLFLVHLCLTNGLRVLS